MTDEEAIRVLSVIHLGKSLRAKEACEIGIKAIKGKERGHWVQTVSLVSDEIVITCSCCNEAFIGFNTLEVWRDSYYFCPLCGADMREEDI